MDWDTARADAFKGPRSYGWLWRPAADVLVTRLVGHADLSAVSFYTERAAAVLAEGHRLHAFHDWRGLRSHDAAARDELQRFGDAEKDRIEEAHYLLESVVVSTAISVAAVALGRRLLTHGSFAAFEAALDECLGASLE